MKSKTRNLFYNCIQWTWGLPQTLAGAALYLKHRKDPHFDYNGARVTAWKDDRGISLGRYIFVPQENSGATSDEDISAGQNSPAEKQAKVSSFLLNHEYGHTIQSLILGPGYLLLVGLPSLLWSRLPYFRNMRRRTGKNYYSAVFERTANTLGDKTSRNDSRRQGRNDR